MSYKMLEITKKKDYENKLYIFGGISNGMANNNMIILNKKNKWNVNYP